MIEPCSFPEEPCEHHMCLDCMKDMFVRGSTEVFKFDKSLNKVCAKCPICRAFSFVDLSEGTDNLIQVDKEYQTLLRDTYKYEFNANCNPDYHEELAYAH